MQQAEDFRAESLALATLMAPLTEADYTLPTLFKQWTLNDILGHLHLFNVAALRTLESADAFEVLFAPVRQGLAQGRPMLETQGPWLDGLAGRALFETWRAGCEAVADTYAIADPKRRVKWGGPDMSAQSCITARQMETWAHGQAVFDRLGIGRVEHDRIRNIVHLGVSTFGWTFVVRGLPVPQPAPQVRLVAPSGAGWTWNDQHPGHVVHGTAVDFARVVTQVRNVADTALIAEGEAATRWLAMAQCFAGPPETPPAPGARHVWRG
ncbi:MAG: TIGR03084 family metal-binding protein [Rubrivivax sp.]